MSGYLLGVDIGTTSLKVAVIDEQAKLLGISAGKYKLIKRDAVSVQIEAESMWNAFLNGVRLLRDGKGIDLTKIVGISISSLCPGLAAMDESGRIIIDPIIYSDRRSVKEAAFIEERIGKKRLFEITANGSMAGAFSGSSMLWIKNHEREAYDKTVFFGHINTYMAGRMTGEFGMDYSNASYTNLFDTAGTKSWSPELCEGIGIDGKKLPPLLDSSAPVGGLRDKDLIGLGIKKGVAVSIGGADTPCATLAAGVTGPGDVCESVGTTNVLTLCVDRPVFDSRFINRCHVVPDTWIYQGAMSFTGASNEWFLEKFYKDYMEKAVDKGDAFAMMNREAEKAAPGSGGVIFLPYMLGERSPIWDPYARGVFFGLSLETGRGEMNRAILEACGYGLRQLAEIYEEVSQKKIKAFVSIGGGAKSDVWAQIKADITGMDITVLDMSDMAPIGAALLAGVGAGVFSSAREAAKQVEKRIYKTFRAQKDKQSVYEKRFNVYKKLYPALKALYKENM